MPFKKLIAILVASLALALCAAGCGDDNESSTDTGGGGGGTPTTAATPAEGPMNTTVTIEPGASTLTDDAFGTNPLIIPTGTTVTWVNNDTTAHTVTSTTGIWDSGRIEPGQSFTRTFTQIGTFRYFCDIHENMRGAVQVAAPPTASPTTVSTPM